MNVPGAQVWVSGEERLSLVRLVLDLIASYVVVQVERWAAVDRFWLSLRRDRATLLIKVLLQS